MSGEGKQQGWELLPEKKENSSQDRYEDNTGGEINPKVFRIPCANKLSPTSSALADNPSVLMICLFLVLPDDPVTRWSTSQ